MKASNANKVISVLLSVAMCPMMVPTAAFAADDGAASGASTAVEQAQPADQAEASGTGASSGNTLAAQSETAGEAAAGEAAAPAAEAAGEASGAATTAAPAAAGEASGEAADPAAETGEEGTEAAIAEVGGTSYPSLQAAIDAASRNATVKLLADTRENVTISTYGVTLDLNGHTLNGSTGERKPALTVTARVTVMDSSAAQTGTIMREDTFENSGVSSHYVIDVQGGDSGWLFFQSGTVKNDSGAGGTKGASLVRVGDDSKPGVPGLTISGGTFTQDNFIVLKCDHGNLYVKGGEINSANSYTVQNWKNTTIKDNAVINGNVSTWTYDGAGSSLTIADGIVNGNVESVTYDGVEGKPAKVAITGGTVNGSLKTVDYSTGTTSNDPTKATIEVTAGAFSADPSRYLVEGSAATPNADGTYGVAKAYLAQVGETSYYTMDEAFKAQTENGGVITLLRDYTTGSTFNSGTVARVVDLNGHTWTCTGTDANSAAFEINYADASLTVKNGKIVSSQLIGLIPSAMGGTITYNNSALMFENVEASTTATSGIETNGNNANDTVVLKDSTLNVPNGFGIYFPSSGTLIIDNSTINAKTMGAQVCSGNLNVTAGSAITVSGDPVEKLEGDGAIQDGAAISIVNRTGYKGLGQIAITGGTFTAKAGNAALKAYTWDSSTKQESAFDNSAKTVAVSGGTFSAAVASDLCVEGYAPVANADGTYSVAEAAPAAVAEVNGTSYPSLQAAIDAAQDGDTVTLLSDIEQNSQLAIGKSITLDLNGKTIKNTVDIWSDNANAILSITNGAKVTITGNGTIDAKENDCYTINVVKGDLTIENGTFYGNVSVVQVEEGALSVKGGTFDLHQKWEGSSKYLFNCIDSAYANGSANVAISGGTFVGFDPNVSPEQKVDGKAPSFAAPGVGITKNEDGSFTAAAGMTAQILDKDSNSVKAYATLQAAINAAEDGQTVTLLTDVADCGSIAISKNITLEGNGHTISGNSSISVNMPGNATADVTIHNVNFKDIANSNKLSAFYFSQVKGKLTITDCTFDSIEYEAIQITPMEGAEINISNNMFKAKADGTQVRHIHIEMAYGSGFDCEGQNIKLTVTDNQLHGTVSGDASMGIWWVGTDSTLKVDGNYMEHPETVSITLANSGVRYNRGDLIYPARSKADVDVDDLMPAAVVADKASGESKIHAYSSLAEAVAAAQDGQTVTLLADATEDVAISKNITLDLGGKTLTNTNAGKATISVQGGTVTVKNGNVLGGTGYYNIEVTKNSNANLTLADVTATAGNTGSSMIDNWGTLTITSGTYTGGLNTVKSEEGSTLSINGGTFTLDYATNGYTAVILVYGDTTITGGEFIQSLTTTGRWNHPQVVATGVVEGYTAITRITGGHFVNKMSGEGIFRGIGKGTSDNFEVSGGTFNKEVSEGYCADGFIPTKNADGTYGVKEGHYVAQVGSTKYETLADAIRLAAKGKTIQLLNDTTENITIAATKQITLDLNGYTLDGGTGNTNATILNEGTLTITDTSAGKTGTIKRDDQGVAGETSYYVIDNNGTMVIDQANVVNNSGAKGSSLIRNGGVDNVSSLTINGGTFEQQNFIAVKNDGNGELTINGGTLTSKQSVVQNWNKAQILGGNLTGIIWTDSWTEAGTIGETVIGGAAQFTGTIYMDVTSPNPSTLKIEGGKLNVTKWTVTSAAAAADATIAVSGGTFTAAVPEDYCAAGYAPTANADGTYGVKLAEGAYLLQDYRSGDQASWTYPTQDGMAFAGWYKDAAFETPCTESDVEGAAYAKFVKITDLLQFRGGSLRMDVAQPSELTWLRFGYTMALPEGASFVENGWYFKKVTTSQPTDVRKLANNNVLNIDGTITANLVFTGVTTNYYSANFSEKAFVKYVTADGTTVEAVESDYQVRSVLDVADVILAHPMASKAEKDYATQIKAAV